MPVAGAAGSGASVPSAGSPAPGSTPTGPAPIRTPTGVALPAIGSNALYVSPSGSDSNPGTHAAPWRSLVKAVSAAPPGSTVVLGAGSYGAVGTRTNWTAAGTSAAPIAFLGDPNAPTRPTILGYNVMTGSHIRVWNLFFDGPTGVIAGENQQEVMIWAHAPDIQINDSEVAHSLWHAGIYVDNGDGDKLLGDYVHDNGNWSAPDQANEDQGIYWGGGSGGVIADNLVSHNYSFGIQLYPSADNVDVEWNTIVANGKSGVIVDASSAHNTVEHNIAAGNAQEGIRSGSSLTGTGNTVTGNFLWGNTQGNAGPDTAGLAWTANSTIDPQFSGSGNYTLQSTSLAVGKAGAYQNGRTAF